MKLLVRRYVTAEQRKRDEFGVTEDDVMEIRQDISTLRFELVDILRNNGMKTPVLDPAENSCKYKLLKTPNRRYYEEKRLVK
jgi:transient receptor potential cation channel subfamily C member 4